MLVTGHTGFKGSWLCHWLTTMGARVTGLALAPDTQPSHWQLLGLTTIDDRRVDIRDAHALRRALTEVNPEIVFHLAAQPLVRRSYRDPIETFSTNVMGLANLFEAIRECRAVQAVVNATTDKVYAEHETLDGYRERDPLGGHDPYSTSKACAEMISDCYRKSFFSHDGERAETTRLATARAGNVIGGGDWAEDRLVPDIARAAITGKPVLIRNPDAIRPWQHVLDPLSGYLLLGQQLLADDDAEGAWNFGPERDGEIAVGQLAEQLAYDWPGVRISRSSDAHPHEAAVLRLNCEKAKNQLSWRPVWGGDETIRHTRDWYLAYQKTGTLRTSSDLAAYVSDAKRMGLVWAT